MTKYYKMRLSRRDTVEMVAFITVTAASCAEAESQAIAWGQSEDNEHLWSENDSGLGRVEALVLDAAPPAPLMTKLETDPDLLDAIARAVERARAAIGTPGQHDAFQDLTALAMQALA